MFSRHDIDSHEATCVSALYECFDSPAMTPILISVAAAVAIIVSAAFLLRRRSPAAESAFADRFDTADLARRLSVEEQQLRDFEPSYREAVIPKRSGGTRRLEIPCEETKGLQRRINARLLRRLNAHPLACGFEEATSIVDAALPHICRKVVVRIDIERFFETTSSNRIHSYFQAIGWQQEPAEILTKLTGVEAHLPQGAPTSPRLSNLVNAPLDAALLKLVRRYRGAYTRYADDMTMSFDDVSGRTVRHVVQQAARTLQQFGYAMNHDKLQIRRSHQQQLVLGLVVNADVNLPRRKRRWLRSVRHRLASGKEASLTKEQLAGWTALEQMIQTQRDE